ncbi:hypothetical protein F66182_5990 [Fusarium sp. NRRL 66182]|nr:hypothetical protein F66182_5990 [Fusarium sp. NRRL 66182]
MSTPPSDRDFQTQCLDLIRGIKSAHERQNDLLEKLVKSLAPPEVITGPEKSISEIDFNQKLAQRLKAPGNSSLDKQRKPDVDSRSEVGLDLDDNNDNQASHAKVQSSKPLEKILRSAPDSYKQRIGLFSGPQVDSAQSDIGLRFPTNNVEIICPVQSWKYWYPGSWTDTQISPVPDFLPWWQLFRRQDQDWYHIDDVNFEHPIQCPDHPWATILGPTIEVPYSYLSGLWALDMLHKSKRHGLVEPGLARWQRDRIRASLDDLYAVPSDNRLPFAFHLSQLRLKSQSSVTGDANARSLNAYLESTGELLDRLSHFVVIDITAPGGSVNAEYYKRRADDSTIPPRVPPCWELVHPALERESKGFVAWPSAVGSHSAGYPPGVFTGRWCRVIQLGGLAHAVADIVREQCTSANASEVWRRLFDDSKLSPEEREAVRAMLDQHLFCRPPAKAPVKFMSSWRHPFWRGFHFSWYELCEAPLNMAEKTSTWRCGHLYGPRGSYIEQKAFTIGCFYKINRFQMNGGGHPDQVFWTILMMCPRNYRSTARYEPSDSQQYCSEDVMLDAIRTSVRRAADAWNSVRAALNSVIEHDPLFLDPEQHDNLLFDDDTFSRSRQYFWIVSCLDYFQRLIDDTIDEWESFRASWPDVLMTIDPEFRPDTVPETSEQVTRRVLGEIEAQIERLRYVSTRFESSREKTKVLREGLFSASGVIESRVSTRLGENVRLLTYVSIFYVPLSFCVALWSTNDHYSRPMLVLTSALVAATTFLIVANLKSMASLWSGTYRHVKGRIIQRMHASKNDQWVRRAAAFESFRPDRHEVEPSEWYILYFAVVSLLVSVASWIRRQGHALSRTADEGQV